MIIQHFNRLLERYCHNLIFLRIKRNQISSTSTEQLFLYLSNKDREEKGYFTNEQIMNLWLNNKSIQKNQKEAFLLHKLKVQKVSYSILHKFIMNGNGTKNHQNSIKFQKQIEQVFSVQLQNYIFQSEILSRMNNYIPMKYSKPTRQQIQQYVICHELTIDIDEITKALNLIDKDINHKSRQKNALENTLANPTTENLQNIMNRLNQRVENFGKEWLQTNP